jgi:hypothetical protein
MVHFFFAKIGYKLNMKGHAGSGLQTVYIRSIKRKRKTTTRSRGTRRKESAKMDTDPLPKELAGFGRARARVFADANGIGLAQRCLLSATSP